SLSTFGFVTIVPRYLLPQVIPSHSFAALTALIVRRVNGDSALLYCINGFADQPMLACTSSRTPPVGALACVPGSGTLPHIITQAFSVINYARNRSECQRGIMQKQNFLRELPYKIV
ncbi:hypothetical protein, partial [Victivallis vadensis]|uniref:hypothetical protein n=1 Tax=Victivallis vadensis TaxID=172901 RepID=UPI003AF74E41